jgi:hypothetical protein
MINTQTPVLTEGEAKCIAQGINVALLRQVAERIKAHPKAFDMESCFYQSTIEGAESVEEAGEKLPALLASECGTTACIAGWTVALAQDEYMPQIGNSLRRARRSLGLDERQASRLFHHDHWPRPFLGQYEGAWEEYDRKEMAEVAARRIEHLIQSGGTE